MNKALIDCLGNPTENYDMLSLGVVREVKSGETRVALAPETIKKFLKKPKLEVWVESGAGDVAGFSDRDYEAAGAKIVKTAQDALKAQLVLKIVKPSDAEIAALAPGSKLISLLEPYTKDGTLEKLATQKIDAIAMELIPRTSRAQSMDVLSSQGNIAGYRAVLESAAHYGRFFAVMMTSAGMSKPAKVFVLGAGVAGLQAIATAKRLGAQVEAFDVRSAVKEQIQSLGAKFFEIDLGEEGSGQGGYAKELSEAAKQRQIQALTEKIQKVDIVISTAAIPGRKAPLLVTEEAVKGMRTGSVVVDMAAATGGNCALTQKDKAIRVHGVTIVGETNYPALLPTDSSQFYSNNLFNLLALALVEENGETKLKWNLEDDIIAASLVTMNGAIRDLTPKPASAAPSATSGGKS